MGKKDDARHQDARSDSFEHVYSIRGDGVAVLKPARLREDQVFVNRIRKWRKLDIIKNK